MESLMDKEIISITETKASIKGTGKMGRRKDLVNQLSTINMDTPDNGSRIKKKAVAPISIPMAKDMKEGG